MNPSDTPPAVPTGTGEAATCDVCRRRKKPVGRDSMDNGLCDAECPGYLQGQHPGYLWHGEAAPPQPSTPEEGGFVESWEEFSAAHPAEATCRGCYDAGYERGRREAICSVCRERLGLEQEGAKAQVVKYKKKLQELYAGSAAKERDDLRADVARLREEFAAAKSRVTELETELGRRIFG